MLSFDLVINLARVLLNQPSGKVTAVHQLVRLQTVLLQAGLQSCELLDVRHAVPIVGQPYGCFKGIIEFLH